MTDSAGGRGRGRSAAPRIDFVRRFAVLAAPYWLARRAWRPWAALAVLTAMIVLGSWLEGQQTYVNRALVDHLAARSLADSYHALGMLLLVTLAIQGTGALRLWQQSHLALSWRLRLTGAFLERYVRARAYYHLERRGRIDNPDERISQDTDLATKSALAMYGDVASAVARAAVFLPIIWGLAPELFPILLSYAAGAAIVFVLLFGSLSRYDARQFRLEADLRFVLIRIRRFAESIAFYRGEPYERGIIDDRFQRAFRNALDILNRTLQLDVSRTVYESVVVAVPMALIAPRYFAHQIDLGAVLQVGVASQALIRSLSFFVLSFAALSLFAAELQRLDELRTELEHAGEGGTSAGEIGPALELVGVGVGVPDTRDRLLSELTVAIAPGSSLLITGANGTGKTSLLRAIAGLWPYEGVIRRPPLEQVLFLPQQPYMIRGSLRAQLAYPAPPATYGDARLAEALRIARLTGLRTRLGFDAEHDFEAILSLGELQRLAFARALLARPALVLIDEGTSAVDDATERALYAALREAVPTYVSVGHRPSLLAYHDVMLLLRGQAAWELVPGRGGSE